MTHIERRQQWKARIEVCKASSLSAKEFCKQHNISERSIKPFVIGRKNWLFSSTPKRARASAMIYSIVETATENGLISFEYLKYLFKKLPNMDVEDKEALDEILPWSTRFAGSLEGEIEMESPHLK